MRAKQVVVVGALDGLVDEVDRLTFSGALIVILESSQQQKMRSDGVVSLVDNLVAIGDDIEPVGVGAEVGLAVVEQGRSCCAVAVGPVNRDRQAIVVAGRLVGKWSDTRDRGDTNAGRVPLLGLLALASEAELSAVVEAGRGLVLYRSPAKEVLIAFFAVVADVKEIPGIGDACGIDAIV